MYNLNRSKKFQLINAVNYNKLLLLAGNNSFYYLSVLYINFLMSYRGS